MLKSIDELETSEISWKKENFDVKSKCPYQQVRLRWQKVETFLQLHNC